MNENKNQILEILKKWFSEKEYQKVISGCMKALEADPNFTEAKNLLEEAKKKTEPEKAETLEESLSKKIPQIIKNEPEEIENPNEQIERSANNLANKLVIASLVIIVFAIGGYLIFNQNSKNREKASAPEKTTKTETTEDKLKALPEKQRTLVENNLKRNADLSDLKTGLQIYYSKYKEYPEPKNLVKALLDEKILISVPYDPRHGQKNTKNELFGYIYTILKINKIKNQGFIVSALFEGFNNANDMSSTFSDQLILPENINFRDLNNTNNILIEEPAKIKRKK